MAFSYSDKNFTVVGNLCFVHIKDDKTGSKTVKIPPAIVDRMLCKNFYTPFISNKSDGSGYGTNACFTSIDSLIYDNTYDVAYLNFFFPIDSNK